MKKIHIVGSSHGDEPFGANVVKELKKAEFCSNLRFTIGNPQALLSKTRFIETDLNRSFNLQKTTLESKIADQIEKDLNAEKPDLIIDIHTSISPVGVVAIIAKENEDLYSAAARLGAEKIVIMGSELAKNSLIGRYQDTSLSLEFGCNSYGRVALKELTHKILNYDAKTAYKPIPILKVTNTISKSFSGLNTIKNLRYDKQLKGFPFLAGPNNYPSIGGYLCELIER